MQRVERKGGSNYFHAKQREQGIIESFTEVCDEKVAQNLRGKFFKSESHRKQQIRSDKIKFWGLVDQLFNYSPSPVILNHRSAQMKSTACIFNCEGFQLVPQSLITFPAPFRIPAFFLTTPTPPKKGSWNFKSFPEKLSKVLHDEVVAGVGVLHRRQSGITPDENFSRRNDVEGKANE